jgi:RNA polymerase sigma-70 factor (ECF subfamily)
MAHGDGSIQERVCALHQRLLAGDVTASGELCDLLVDRLESRLQRRWPLISADDIHDAVVDVVVAYLQDPSRYDPSRASLSGWLELQAHRDLVNVEQRGQRRFDRAVLRLVTDNAESSPSASEQEAVDAVPVEVDLGVFARVRAEFPNEIDRRLIYMMFVEGDRSTASAAKVLGIVDLTAEQQALEVKRHKDRISRRLRRIDLDGSHG